MVVVGDRVQSRVFSEAICTLQRNEEDKEFDPIDHESQRMCCPLGSYEHWFFEHLCDNGGLVKGKEAPTPRKGHLAHSGVLLPLELAAALFELDLMIATRRTIVGARTCRSAALATYQYG